jgi:hypothetical protein
MAAWKEGDRINGSRLPVSDADGFIYGPGYAEYNIRMESSRPLWKSALWARLRTMF